MKCEVCKHEKIEWIKTEYRVPENSRDYTRDDLIIPYIVFNEYRVCIAKFNDGIFQYMGSHHEVKNVTHWAYLPGNPHE